jgi:hypothetical protein
MLGTAFATRRTVVALIVVAFIAGVLSTTTGRNISQTLLGHLRVQKAQAVNVDLTSFVDPNANPALHQMVGQMVSDKVNVTVNENDQPVSNMAEASRVVGFPLQLITARKDAPQLVISGQHAVTMNVDRARLQEIVKAAGHPEIVLPGSLDGASFSVEIPRALHARYGTCPGPTTAANAIANQVIEKPESSADYADCVRFSEGPSPVVHVPDGLDITKLAEIGLQVAGMTPKQASEFFQTVDWKSTLTLSVPRQLRSYEQVKVGGVPATLLALGGRRGPGYTLIWAKNGTAFSLTGYGDASHAVELADSVK